MYLDIHRHQAHALRRASLPIAAILIEVRSKSFSGVIVTVR